MVMVDCPWCSEDTLVAFPDLDGPEASATCAECGTTFVFAEEEADSLDPAA